jgi:hypothetical protein
MNTPAVHFTSLDLIGLRSTVYAHQYFELALARSLNDVEIARVEKQALYARVLKAQVKGTVRRDLRGVKSGINR